MVSLNTLRSYASRSAPFLLPALAVGLAGYAWSQASRDSSSSVGTTDIVPRTSILPRYEAKPEYTQLLKVFGLHSQLSADSSLPISAVEMKPPLFPSPLPPSSRPSIPPKGGRLKPTTDICSPVLTDYGHGCDMQLPSAASTEKVNAAHALGTTAGTDVSPELPLNAKPSVLKSEAFRPDASSPRSFPAFATETDSVIRQSPPLPSTPAIPEDTNQVYWFQKRPPSPSEIDQSWYPCTLSPSFYFEHLNDDTGVSYIRHRDDEHIIFSQHSSQGDLSLFYDWKVRYDHHRDEFAVVNATCPAASLVAPDDVLEEVRLFTQLIPEIPDHAMTQFEALSDFHERLTFLHEAQRMRTRRYIDILKAEGYKRCAMNDGTLSLDPDNSAGENEDPKPPEAQRSFDAFKGYMPYEQSVAHQEAMKNGADVQCFPSRETLMNGEALGSPGTSIFPVHRKVCVNSHTGCVGYTDDERDSAREPVDKQEYAHVSRYPLATDF